MKTNRQKCLEMWQWFVESPGAYGYLNGKNDYFDYLDKKNRLEDFNFCWACVEALSISRQGTCFYCPIDWKVEKGYCLNINTPYKKWKISETKEDRVKYAKQMMKLIEDTWVI